MAARHVLVPLGVAGLVLAILLWRDGDEPVVEMPDDVAACAAHLRAIHAALVREHERAGRLPDAAGPALLGALLASGALEDADSLACPGPRAEPPPPGGLADGDVTSADTGYAARDLVAHPLPRYPCGGRELASVAACDGARAMNHDGRTNVLYSDGSVVTLSLAHEIETGRLPPGATAIPVGPGSPIPDLAKLVP